MMEAPLLDFLDKTGFEQTRTSEQVQGIVAKVNEDISQYLDVAVEFLE